MNKYSSVPKITVAVMNFNGLSYLKRTLPQLILLNYPDYEIIVVDNNSSDGSRDFIESYQDKVTLIKNDHTGSKNRGLNLAIERSRGEFILFIDNDVLIHDRDLPSLLLSFYRDLKNPGLVTCTLLNEAEKTVYFYGEYLSYYSFIKRNKRIPFENIGLIHGDRVVGVLGAAFFTRKDIFDTIGKFDEQIPFGGEDVDVGIRSMLHGFANYIFAERLLIHIGMNERRNNSINRRNYVGNNFGLITTIVKNYKFSNLLFSLSLFIAYLALKTLKDSIVRADVLLPLEYIKTLWSIIANRRAILEQRRHTQVSREIKCDEFLSVRQKIITS